MQYREAELVLDAAQDSARDVGWILFCTRRGGHGKADMAHENVESARRALTLELKKSNLKVQATTDSKQNIDFLHTDCAWLLEGVNFRMLKCSCTT